MQTTTALSYFLVLCFSVTCWGHGGSFHDYPAGGVPSGTDAKIKVGSCSTWTPIGTSASKSVSKLANGGRRLAAAMSVDGTADFWIKTPDNCTGDYMGSIIVNLNITSGTKAASNATVNGKVRTGTCADPGDVYLLDQTAAETSGNTLYFKNTTTTATGALKGSFANDGAMATSGTGAPKSIYLYGDDGAFACCSLAMTQTTASYQKALNASAVDCSGQIGMFMDGKFFACPLVDGKYVMDHGGIQVECMELRNGSKINKTSNSTPTASKKNAAGHTWGAGMAASALVASAMVLVVGLLL